MVQLHGGRLPIGYTTNGDDAECVLTQQLYDPSAVLMYIHTLTTELGGHAVKSALNWSRLMHAAPRTRGRHASARVAASSTETACGLQRVMSLIRETPGDAAVVESRPMRVFCRQKASTSLVRARGRARLIFAQSSFWGAAWARCSGARLSRASTLQAQSLPGPPSPRRCQKRACSRPCGRPCHHAEEGPF